MAVKPWEPREIPTLSSAFPAGHVQSTPPLESFPQQDYEKSPAGASHIQETHPFLPPATLCPSRCGRLEVYSLHTGALPAPGGKTEGIHFCLCTRDKSYKLTRTAKITINIPHFNISTVQKRCLQLTFVYFTLRTAKEHLCIVSTQVRFSEQFSSVHHLLLENLVLFIFQSKILRTNISFSSVIHPSLYSTPAERTEDLQLPWLTT